MAEYVQYRTEETIPELEQLQRIGLLDASEIRSIIKRRKELEYKIQRRTKCKEDYMQYIQYEIHLLKLIKMRRKKSRKFMKKAEIEHCITNRVDKLFTTVVRKFKEDINMWLSHIKFCKDVGFTAAVNRIMVQMLAVHGDKPHLWKMAADWEFNEGHSIENARKYLQRGLHFHPESQLLYKELFHLELKNARNDREKLMENDQEEDSAERLQQLENPILEGRVAEVVYDSAYDAIKCVGFSFECLAIAEKYDFTKNLQEKIMKKLASNKSDTVEFWDMLAKRALNGLLIESKLFGEDGPGLVELEVQNPSEEQMMSACVAIYEKAVTVVSTSEMWTAYLTCVSEIPANTDFGCRLLLKAYSGAHSCGMMQGMFYAQYVELLIESDRKEMALQVLSEAVGLHPQDHELWLRFLRCLLEEGDTEQAAAVHELAIANVTEQDDRLLPLWSLMIRHYSSIDDERADGMFQRGLSLGTKVSQMLKPVYLDWLHLTKGIEAVRSSYNRLTLQPPLSLELHVKMIQIELLQSVVDADCVRRCFDLATHQFGSETCDLWQQYYHFEARHGNSHKSNVVYHRAIDALKPSLVNEFLSEFNLNRTVCSQSSDSE